MLTSEDAFNAASTATVQMLRKLQLGRDSDHGGKSTRGQKQRWADTMHATLAEIAFARLANLAWTAGGFRVSRRPDVGDLVEVRATEYENGHLIIYETDPADRIVALMVGGYPCMHCAGFMYAGDGKKPELWRDGSNVNLPAWWVPQSMLVELSELRTLVPA